MMKTMAILLWFSSAAVVIPLDAATEEIADQHGVFEFLREVSRANRSLFGQGRIQASGHEVSYDEKGLEKQEEDGFQATGIFKNEKVRLDFTTKVGDLLKERRTVTTEEDFKEYFKGETSAYLRDPKLAHVGHAISGFLPSTSVAFWHRYLERAMLRDEEVLSSKITRSHIDDGTVYVIELVWKKDPLNLRRFHADPSKGGAVVKFESYHDFGKGHVLILQSDVQMQPAGGDWYPKRVTQTLYRPDGTLRREEAMEIKKFDFTSEVSDDEFTWEGMGLPAGTTIVDKRMDITYKYGVPPVDDEIVYDVLKDPLVQEAVAHTSTAGHAEPREEAVAVQEQLREPTRSNKGVQATSSRSVHLLVGVGTVLILTITLFAVRRYKQHVRGVE